MVASIGATQVWVCSIGAGGPSSGYSGTVRGGHLQKADTYCSHSSRETEDLAEQNMHTLVKS